MAVFQGKLGQNKVLFSETAGALYNMILNQEVESRTIGGGMATLLDEATRDVGLYGDRILKYFTDVLRVYDFEADSADQLNLLKTYRPEPPTCEEIVVDTAKFIPLTLDNYLTKQGFANEATFGQFNDVMRSWLQNTKKVFLAKEYNVFIGTEKTVDGKQNVSFDYNIKDGAETYSGSEAQLRLQAQAVATFVADAIVAITEDATRDYNDLGKMACFDKKDLLIVWNSDVLNRITYMDLPTMFNDNEILATLKQNMRRLPGKYFGEIIEAGTASEVKSDGATHRFLHQTVISGKVYFAGDLIPQNTVIRTAAGVIQIPAYESAVISPYGPQDADLPACVICRIIHKDSAPVLAGFETTTEFWNPSNLSTNDYLHFLYNSFKRFGGYPWVTISAS